MPIRMRHIARELGAAFAVLALYMLVLLAPLHQSAGLQRDLALLGYESSLSWSVCTSVADPTGNPETPLAAKCPVAGVAKFELAVLPPPDKLAAPALVSVPVRYSALENLKAQAQPHAPGQPRAPPSLV